MFVNNCEQMYTMYNYINFCMLDPGYRQPWYLQEVESRIASRSLCKNIANDFFREIFTQNQLCSLDNETGGCDVSPNFS